MITRPRRRDLLSPFLRILVEKPTIVPSEKNDLRPLLEEVLADPLGLNGTAHIREWLEALKENFPLWSFQAGAYYDLHRAAKEEAVGPPASGEDRVDFDARWYTKGFLPPGETLPSCYPAGALVDSILRDDGMGRFEQLGPLSYAIHLRRVALTAKAEPTDVSLCPPDWDPQNQYEEMLFWFEPQDAALRAAGYDSGDLGPLGSIYEFLGRWLVEDVESWISAPDRVEGRKGLNSSVHAIAVELGAEPVDKKGGQPKGPRPQILKALVREGEALLEVCWELPPINLNAQSRKVLDALGVTTVTDEERWSARLALPVLSRPEIHALQDPTGGGVDVLAGRVYKKARRLAVWILAHRLQMKASTVSRKGVNPPDSEKFKKDLSPGVRKRAPGDP